MNPANAETDSRQLQQSSLDQLEYPRILEHISGYAYTSLGVEHVLATTPLTDAATVRSELRMVGEVRSLIAREEPVPLDGIFDIRPALSASTVKGNWLAGEDLFAVYTTIRGYRRLRDFIVARRDDAPLLADHVEPVHSNRLLEKHITDAISDSGEVRDAASRTLFGIRREIVSKSAALRERLERILQRVADEEMVTEEFVTLREGRLVLPVRAEYKRKIPGIIHGESNTGATVFLEPAEIFNMNNEIAELTFAERREVERILSTLTSELGAEAEQFREAVSRVQLVDAIVARARYAEARNCTEPKIVDEPSIQLQNARHPLLQLRLDNVVPMSLELDRESECVIISGPNAGGKTVAVITAGLILSMARSGIHPPADTCVCHLGQVYTDIGDRQSIESDLSTFSAHMSRVREILSSSMRGDLILLDELGTGTDPDEGAAIASSILDQLLQRQTLVLVTTHHSALKVYAYNHDHVLNAGMQFDTDTLRPTYQLMIGVPGNSYAFDLLNRFGFDEEVIEGARAYLGEDRSNLTEIVRELEERLTDVRSESESQAVERDRIASHADQVRAKEEELTERRTEFIEKARTEAREIVENANSLVENALREIRGGASDERVKELRKEIRETREKLGVRKQEPSGTETHDGLGRGDRVRMTDGKEVGEVLSEPDDTGDVVVQFGPIRMRTNSSELQKVAAPNQKQDSSEKSKPRIEHAVEAETRVDLRGMYGDEAVVALDQAISAALDAGLVRIDIIHGKGTGALRQRTHQLLKEHPHVASFRLGTLTEGGSGVTIAELT